MPATAAAAAVGTAGSWPGAVAAARAEVRRQLALLLLLHVLRAACCVAAIPIIATTTTLVARIILVRLYDLALQPLRDEQRDVECFRLCGTVDRIVSVLGSGRTLMWPQKLPLTTSTERAARKHLRAVSSKSHSLLRRLLPFLKRQLLRPMFAPDAPACRGASWLQADQHLAPMQCFPFSCCIPLPALCCRQHERE